MDGMTGPVAQRAPPGKGPKGCVAVGREKRQKSICGIGISTPAWCGRATRHPTSVTPSALPSHKALCEDHTESGLPVQSKPPEDTRHQGQEGGGEGGINVSFHPLISYHPEWLAMMGQHSVTVVGTRTVSGLLQQGRRFLVM